ncbi:hypothetical protein [Conexibacter sp. CPCC 206217]|uniref:hypothetical protein n=1 Tax=Conexibacter sp. CPCC 206217 TaxID=3064574 RepID=UPI0027281AEF|nr:hypothetical protein [Conexibacter sp. CPCC 206217]MDO8210436.1 hypothetical protein [Conexibacter sp. CPCC 206217]
MTEPDAKERRVVALLADADCPWGPMPLQRASHALPVASFLRFVAERGESQEGVEQIVDRLVIASGGSRDEELNPVIRLKAWARRRRRLPTDSTDIWVAPETFPRSVSDGHAGAGY